MTRSKVLITKHTLLFDPKKALENHQRMVKKTKISHVRFRPNFKTYQSARMGELVQELSVSVIMVSALTMEMYFVRHGWRDITIAFPVNILEIGNINKLASAIQCYSRHTYHADCTNEFNVTHNETVQRLNGLKEQLFTESFDNSQNSIRDMPP